jgi:hypothetical protein
LAIVLTGLRRRHAPAGAADDDGHLALVVQVLAALRPDHGAAVPDERGNRLLEVGRRRGQLGPELGDPAQVVEVHRDDLGRCYRRQVHRVRGADPAAVAGDQVLAVATDLDGRAVQQDPAVFRHF